MTKKDLRTGMFGIVEDGRGLEKFFVVVNDKLVYQHGGHDNIPCLKDDLDYGVYRITKIFNKLVYSFDLAKIYKCDQGYIFWERDNSIEMTVAEIEQKLGIKNLKIVKE